MAVDGRAEQAELAHLAEDLAIDPLEPVGLADPRHQLLLRVVARGRLDQALVLRQLEIEPERVVPGELGPGLARGPGDNRLE